MNVKPKKGSQPANSRPAHDPAATIGTVRRVRLSQLQVDPAIQCRAKMDDPTVAEYAEAMLAGTKFPALVGYQDGSGNILIADGGHRYAAAVRAGLKVLDVEVRKGTRRDAMLGAAMANVSHGLRRTNADKRRAVQRLLDDAEWKLWSDGEIARQCGVTDKTVATLRDSHPGNSGVRTRKFHTKHGTVAQCRVHQPRRAGSPVAKLGTAPVALARQDMAEPYGPADDGQTAADLEPVPDVPDPPDVGDTDDEGPNRLVIRAIEAGEAVLALDDELMSVPQDILERFRSTFKNLSHLWRRLFLVNPGESPATSQASENLERDA